MDPVLAVLLGLTAGMLVSAFVMGVPRGWHHAHEDDLPPKLVQSMGHGLSLVADGGRVVCRLSPGERSGEYAARFDTLRFQGNRGPDGNVLDDSQRAGADAILRQFDADLDAAIANTLRDAQARFQDYLVRLGDAKSHPGDVPVASAHVRAADTPAMSDA